MKSCFIIVFFALSVFSGVNVTAADVTVNKWECSSDGRAGGAALCYVTNVRFRPGNQPYVMAKLHTPDDGTNCRYIRVVDNDTADLVEGVRGTEALLLVALTTGLPVKYYVKTRDGSLCTVSSVTVSKPGH